MVVRRVCLAPLTSLTTGFSLELVILAYSDDTWQNICVYYCIFYQHQQREYKYIYILFSSLINKDVVEMKGQNMLDWQYINQANKLRPLPARQCLIMRWISCAHNANILTSFVAKFVPNCSGWQAYSSSHLAARARMDIVQCVQLVLINMSIMTTSGIARCNESCYTLTAGLIGHLCVCVRAMLVGWKVNIQQGQQWRPP